MAAGASQHGVALAGTGPRLRTWRRRCS
jgi:hypothetical protein